jgi:hypothetical protein
MRPWVFLLAVAVGTAAAEDLDVITLRDGRVLEGHYNDLSGVMRTVAGKLHGSVVIDPADIVSHTTRSVPDADDAADAPAPAPPPPAPAPHIDADRAARAQRQIDLAERQRLVQDLADSADYQRLYQREIDQDEADQKDIPPQLRDLEQHTADARDQLDKDRVRQGQIERLERDSRADLDARATCDQDSAALAKLQADAEALRKKQARIEAELPVLRGKFKDAVAHQVKDRAALDAMDGNEDPLATLAGPDAATAPAAATVPASKP